MKKELFISLIVIAGLSVVSCSSRYTAGLTSEQREHIRKVDSLFTHYGWKIDSKVSKAERIRRSLNIDYDSARIFLESIEINKKGK